MRLQWKINLFWALFSCCIHKNIAILGAQCTKIYLNSTLMASKDYPNGGNTAFNTKFEQLTTNIVLIRWKKL